MAEHNNHQRPANRHLEVPAPSGGLCLRPQEIQVPYTEVSVLRAIALQASFIPVLPEDQREYSGLWGGLHVKQVPTWSLSIEFKDEGMASQRVSPHQRSSVKETTRRGWYKQEKQEKRSFRATPCEGWWALGSHSSTERGFTRILRPWQTDTLTPISEHHVFLPYFQNWVFLIVRTFSPLLA